MSIFTETSYIRIIIDKTLKFCTRVSWVRVSLGRTIFIFRHPSVNVTLQDVREKPGELFFTNQAAPDSSHLRKTLARYNEKNIEASNGSFNVVWR